MLSMQPYHERRKAHKTSALQLTCNPAVTNSTPMNMGLLWRSLNTFSSSLMRRELICSAQHEEGGPAPCTQCIWDANKRGCRQGADTQTMLHRITLVLIHPVLHECNHCLGCTLRRAQRGCSHSPCCTISIPYPPILHLHDWHSTSACLPH